MAVLTEVRNPYEVLIRWGQNGEIQGAHIAWLDSVLKDGAVISQTPTNVESVAIGLVEGYPLADILNQITIDLLVKNEEIEAEKLVLQAEIQALKSIPNETETI